MPTPLPPPSSPMPDWGATYAVLRRIAGALTQNAHEADDLTQHTVLKLLGAGGSGDVPPALARRVMVRTWIDGQRSTRRRLRRLAHIAARTMTVMRFRDPLEDAEAHDRARAVVASLPPRQRAAIVLRVIEEMEVPAIAETLGCSVEAVRASLHLARRSVRERLRDMR